MAVTTFLPVIGRHAVAIPVGDSINEIRYACAPGTPVFSILDGSLSFTEDGMSVRSLKGRLIVTYLGVDQAEAGTMQADVLAAGQFIGRVTGRDGVPGLFVRANLGDDLHDIATLLSDADDPVVMWPKGVGQIARPSNPAGPARSTPTADSPRTAEEEPPRNRSVRSAPPILQSSEESEPESPIDTMFEEPQPAIEVEAEIVVEAKADVDVDVEADSDVDAKADAGVEVAVEPEVETNTRCSGSPRPPQ